MIMVPLDLPTSRDSLGETWRKISEVCGGAVEGGALVIGLHMV